MQMAKWTAFPHPGEFSYTAAALKKHWPRLHAGDAEPLPKDEAVLQAFPMYACELTAEGRLPPLANFRRWTDLLALDRAPQPWFHFRMNGHPSGLDVPQWGTQGWAGVEDFIDILSRDDRSWLEVRNRKGRILRLPDSHGWDCARERVAAHVGRVIASGDDSEWAQTRAG